MREISNVIVTGGLGFIGSNFIEEALKKGWHITNIDKKTYAASDIDFGQHKNYKLIVADIKDITSLPNCDLIINFAAESHVDNSIESSDVFLKSNIEGVHNILNIIIRQMNSNFLHGWNYATPIFFQISTDEVFGDIPEGFFKTTDPLIPSNPYSATKAAAEMLVRAWGRTYNIPFFISRTTNNYGPRQHSEKLIPNTISSILSGKKVPIHGEGKHIRNWIHVQDNVNALMTIIEKGILSSYYHIASNEEYSVVEVIKRIAKILKKDFTDISEYTADRSGADVRYALDIQETTELGWEQKISFDQGINELIGLYLSAENK
jgi:dTDP-glucose 4,6-dehydratase